MLALVEISIWHWIGFVAAVLILLGLDLCVFHRRAHVVRFKEALLWTGIWFCLAMLFAFSLMPILTKNLGPAVSERKSLEFLTGYLIELSLSMDNMFVIALIFAYFQVPSQHQHRVLFWGILGALAMRGLMITVGVVLIDWLDWILYVFGLLIVVSGIKMLFTHTEVAPEKNLVVRLARKIFPVAPHFDGEKFRTEWNGHMALTPLALALVMVETMDLVFAIDSIPAIFAVTRDPFIVFTSNVFAILGLRSLYFVLAGAIGYFRYLKYGLALVLVFIGVKMLIDPHDDPPRWFQVDIPIGTSLITVAGIILISMAVSVAASYRERKRNQ
jgi:tellurite resistance protein TerC